MKDKISIVSMGSISPLGVDNEAIWNAYKTTNHFISSSNLDLKNDFSAQISVNSEKLIQELKQENQKYKNLDRTVLLGIIATRNAFKKSNWKTGEGVGVNLGSSRGATELFENFHTEFINNGLQKVNPLTSPTTTLGNISSWVANDLNTNGVVLSHSVTCSTSSHAILNGIAWINSGMNDRFIVGGSEAPITFFTIVQMQSLKIYSSLKEAYPCQSLNFDKKQNTMILGEGSAVFCLEKGIVNNAIAIISGIGYGSEKLTHNVSISEEGDSLQKSMKMALKGVELNSIDAIVMHAPGTIKGDASEFKAIKHIFGNELPALTSNKWKIGHALGASGALNVEMAILMIHNNELIESPFYKNKNIPSKIKRVLINSVGFGGNAVSILVEHNN